MVSLCHMGLVLLQLLQLGMRSWRYPVNVWHVKGEAVNEYHLEMNCRRSARNLKLAVIPAAIVILHSIWEELFLKPIK